MAKDYRYEVVKTMIEAGKITEFSQIFNHIPIRVVADDLNSSFRRISNFIKQPGKLELGQMQALSELIDVNIDVIYALSKKQFLPAEVKVAKKKKK
jgi:hypothetical protein